MYAAWIGGAALLTYAKEVAFAFGAMRAARTLHDKLLERVLGGGSQRCLACILMLLTQRVPNPSCAPGLQLR